MITTRVMAVFCASLLAAQQPYAFAQQPQSPAPSGTQSQVTLTPGQLDSLVAPIALYPDPILSQMLVASTYPLEIVEAGRWVKQNPNLQGKALTEAAAKQPWDASVQALVGLPQALQKLDQDAGWTSDLGNAFLAQQADVMAAIQRMRQRAADAGALQSTPQQTVSTTTENGQSFIEIQPASPQVVYVPVYNPEAIWGPAPDYYPWPALYYPPVSTGAAIAASAISFGAGIAIGAIWGGGWNNWGWNASWGHNNVVINNNFINSNRFNRVNVANGNNWVHNPAHRDGVPYNNRAVANRFQGGGNLPAGRPTAAQVQQGLSQGGRRGPGGAGALSGQGANRMAPGNIPPGGANRMAPGAMGGDANRIGNRTMPSPSPAAGAFGGMNQGGNRVRMDSNRGFSSRGFGGGGFGGGGFRGGGGRRR